MSDEPSDEALLDICNEAFSVNHQRSAENRALYNAGKEAGRASMQRELEEAKAKLDAICREFSEHWPWGPESTFTHGCLPGKVREARARIAELEAGQVNAAVEMLLKEADANETYGIEYFVAAKWLEENTGAEARAVRVTLGEFLASHQSAYWWACYTPGSAEVTICTADEAERSGYHVVAHASRSTLGEAIAAAVDAAVLHFRNPAVQDAIDKLASDRRERKPERCPACGGTGITGYWEKETLVNASVAAGQRLEWLPFGLEDFPEGNTALFRFAGADGADYYFVDRITWDSESPPQWDEGDAGVEFDAVTHYALFNAPEAKASREAEASPAVDINAEQRKDGLP